MLTHTHTHPEDAQISSAIVRKINTEAHTQSWSRCTNRPWFVCGMLIQRCCRTIIISYLGTRKEQQPIKKQLHTCLLRNANKTCNKNTTHHQPSEARPNSTTNNARFNRHPTQTQSSAQSHKFVCEICRVCTISQGQRLGGAPAIGVRGHIQNPRCGTTYICTACDAWTPLHSRRATDGSN